MAGNAGVIHPEPKLARSGVLRIVTVLLAAVLRAALYFLAAGTLDIARAWIFRARTEPRPGAERGRFAAAVILTP